MTDNKPVPENQNPDDFFVAGGTMRGYAHSYIVRPADGELFQTVSKGREFCYVLTPRQMGKSSLMVRTRNLLDDLTFRTAIIDITQIGVSVSEEQWYLSLLKRLQSQLRLSTDVQAWWERWINLSPVNRFSHFLREVVLNEIEQSVAIFIDEIDATLGLNFADEFFAVIRAAYNARASDPAYYRLTFVFLGVATPNDLVKDPDKAPFNIGKRIDLREFSQEDAQKLKQGLGSYVSQDVAPIFDRIFYWTNGHPFLTQKICLEIASSGSKKWTNAQIDHLVEELFLSDKATNEPNIQFMREYIKNSANCRELLKLYERVYTRETVAEVEHSPIQNQLKLIGLLQVETGQPPRKLIVRNRIYKNVFNQNWIQEAKCPSELSKLLVKIAALVVLLITIAVLGYSFIPSINFPWTATVTMTMPTVTTEFIQVSNATETTAPLTSTLPPTEAPVVILSTPPPSDTPTLTLTPSSTAAPIVALTSTSTIMIESTAIPTAIANQFARVFRSATTRSEELSSISAGESVEVLGRSVGRFDSVTGNPGFYVRMEDGTEGFVVFRFLNWPGDVLDLPMIAIILANGTLYEQPNEASNSVGNLTADLPVEILGRLENADWLYVRTRDGLEGFVNRHETIDLLSDAMMLVPIVQP